MGLAEFSSIDRSTDTEAKNIRKGVLINFEGVGERDVYNTTPPFIFEGKPCIAGRVEPRESELDSQVIFFGKNGASWQPILDIPTFRLQDPFITKVDGEFVFGGTEIYQVPNPGNPGYRINFFRGNSLRTLKQFAVGPDMMKGIRLIELPNKMVLVLTRPTSSCVNGTGRGRMGYLIIPSLKDLSPDNILNAKIIPGLFNENEWVGPNEQQLLVNGFVGILGHIAHIDEGPNEKLHYQAMTLTINPANGGVSPITIIASRKDFPDGPAKCYPKHSDVCYPSGLIPLSNRLGVLYLGLSDTQESSKIIDWPFPFGPILQPLSPKFF